jgi:hypothetical protein
MNQVVLQGQTLPFWIQVLMAVIAVLSFLGGACAFLFIMWPAIRKGERRAERVEAWLNSVEGKKVTNALISKAMGMPGERVKPDQFLRETSESDVTKSGL